MSSATRNRSDSYAAIICGASPRVHYRSGRRRNRWEANDVVVVVPWKQKRWDELVGRMAFEDQTTSQKDTHRRYHESANEYRNDNQSTDTRTQRGLFVTTIPHSFQDVLVVTMVGPSPPRKQPLSPVKSSSRRSFSYRRPKTPTDSLRSKTEAQRSVSAYLNARIPAAKQKKKHPPAAEPKPSKKRPPPPVKWVDPSHISYTRGGHHQERASHETRSERLESPHFPCWNVLRFPEPPLSDTPCSVTHITVSSVLPDRAFRSLYHKTISKNASTRYTAELQRILFPTTHRSLPPLLRQWNQELAALTQYIQLTPEEMHLRHAFLDRLERQFLAAHQKRAQVFGSFATTPICTFQSDLDVALWDVVTPVVVTSDTATTSVLAPLDAPVSSKNDATDPPNMTKELLVEKWKLALAAVTLENHDETSTTHTAAPTSSSSSDVVEIEDGKDPRSSASSAVSKASLNGTHDENPRQEQIIQKYKWPVLETIDLTNEDGDKANVTHVMDGITLDYCGEEAQNDDDSASDHDSADPMTSYENRPLLQHPTGAFSESQRDPSIHVSWYASSKPNSRPPNASSSNNHHPMPAYRKAQVVETLSALCSSLRKKAHRRDMAIQHITLIKTAKVPIIKIQTTHGFPVDIAVGGFGTDTSLYAQKQMARYPYSFVPVVIVLKTLLAQHQLDEPYSGGLGSYKLYILVAHHIHMHLQQQKDSEDREHCPFIMLYTFLYRYGYGQEEEHRSWKRKKLTENSINVWSYPTTPLCQYVPFSAQDGIGSSTCADLSNVYKLKECLSLFRTCFQRLNDQMHKAVSQPTEADSSMSHAQSCTSLLAHVICPWKLQQDREQVLAKTKGSTTAAMTRPPPTASRGAPQGGRSQGKRSNVLEQREDRTLEEIVAGYGIRVEDLTSP
jgi:hypothetical protein